MSVLGLSVSVLGLSVSVSHLSELASVTVSWVVVPPSSLGRRIVATTTKHANNKIFTASPSPSTQLCIRPQLPGSQVYQTRSTKFTVRVPHGWIDCVPAPTLKAFFYIYRDFI